MRENKATICEVLGWNQVNSENLSFLNSMGVDGLSINGLPVIVWAYPRGRDINEKGGKDSR